MRICGQLALSFLCGVGVLYSGVVFGTGQFEIDSGVSIVAAPQVKRMVEDPTVLLVNNLSEVEYDIQHIPKSVNIPVTHAFETDALGTMLPKDREQTIIFYCMGDICPYSRIAANAALRLGYNSVYWFRGGIMQWRKYQYPVIQNDDIIKQKIKKLPN